MEAYISIGSRKVNIHALNRQHQLALLSEKTRDVLATIGKHRDLMSASGLETSNIFGMMV
jgi:hypothetical protein